MSKTDFKGGWTIRASTSRFFPTQSSLDLTPKVPKSAGFELEVTWEGQDQAKLKLIEEGFVQEGRTLQGKFRFPRQSAEEFELVVSLCPCADGKTRLVGLLLQTDGREPGSTGVWVAEVQQPPIDPPPQE